ncbi:trehalase family glycosidase [Actinoplanes sp. NEAU-A12]|uniref:Trehalase family glycosidase n=1 Tax=Actinoplanes sandaracinus TaxID=3045177 RepID=A0ABT6WGG1_9ACTN|nr:trehalase family glycosidase [Actinoplanes sandaracinus]MDI6098809.1 trehalase family glycosidase [Actinoplanes sandaracinus]
MTTACVARRPLLEPADALDRAARRVLATNWRRHATVPAARLYPHQWSWDSAFIAIGLRHLSPARAQRELESLFGAQWRDGRVPHIVFEPHVPADAYFPGPSFWRSTATPGAPAVATSGIVQPPAHALAVWLTYRADPATARARGFLPRLYPRLIAWHRYLTTRRDLTGSGLMSVVHPWESGMDNSPAWDAPLSRVTPVPPGEFTRRDLDHAAAAERPTDADYGRYVRLARDYRDAGYADSLRGHGFAVEDPLCNALLAAGEHALASMATELGRDPQPHRAAAARLTDALTATLYDPAAGIFFPRDAHTGGHIRSYSVGGLMPLIVPGLPVAAELVETALGDRFRLREACPVPSYDLSAGDHDPSLYWRGPGWVNTSWLLWHGLRLHGEASLADDLRQRLLGRVRDAGFREYLDPMTGTGHGADEFSWTAALVLDLIRAP